MIEIDGSYGEGGGQIVRTATSLSAYTGKPVRIRNIRANRSKPGLRPQHVKGVEALADLCDAESSGVEVGKSSLVFRPGKIKHRDMEIDIGTAGSVTLLLQSLMPPLVRCIKELDITVKGGTDVKWSPPADYLKYVLLPILRDHGFVAYLDVEKRGFYPKGGGKVVLHLKEMDLKEFDLVGRGDTEKVCGISYASNHLQGARVAHRQAKAARKVLREKLGLESDIKTEYCESMSPGSGIQLWLKTTNSVIGGNALGERGTPSEKVGRKAAEDLINDPKGAVDKYAGDQLIPFLGLVGGKIEISKRTEHSKTNQAIVEKFLDVSFETDGYTIKSHKE